VPPSWVANRVATDVIAPHASRVLSTRHATRERRRAGPDGHPAHPRRRAKGAVPVDLILADHRAGMSCRQLATKYGFKSGNSISRLLKQHGEQPAPPGWSRAIVPISSAAANPAYRMRQKPPLVIPARTPAERQYRRFTSLELEAIQQAIAAGRVQYVRRGVLGLRWHRADQPDEPAVAVRAQVLERLRVLRATLARAA
jgi:hypothetical protein